MFIISPIKREYENGHCKKCKEKIFISEKKKTTKCPYCGHINKKKE